jgi:hypothetical protein
VDQGPRWPWLRDEDEKPAEAMPRAGDAEVLEWLREEPEAAVNVSGETQQ